MTSTPIYFHWNSQRGHSEGCWSTLAKPASPWCWEDSQGDLRKSKKQTQNEVELYDAILIPRKSTGEADGSNHIISNCKSEGIYPSLKTSHFICSEPVRIWLDQLFSLRVLPHLESLETFWTYVNTTIARWCKTTEPRLPTRRHQVVLIFSAQQQAPKECLSKWKVWSGTFMYCCLHMALFDREFRIPLFHSFIHNLINVTVYQIAL